MDTTLSILRKLGNGCCLELAGGHAEIWRLYDMFIVFEVPEIDERPIFNTIFNSARDALNMVESWT